MSLLLNSALVAGKRPLKTLYKWACSSKNLWMGIEISILSNFSFWEILFFSFDSPYQPFKNVKTVLSLRAVPTQAIGSLLLSSQSAALHSWWQVGLKKTPPSWATLCMSPHGHRATRTKNFLSLWRWIWVHKRFLSYWKIFSIYWIDTTGSLVARR